MRVLGATEDEAGQERAQGVGDAGDVADPGHPAERQEDLVTDRVLCFVCHCMTSSLDVLVRQADCPNGFSCCHYRNQLGSGGQPAATESRPQTGFQGL